VEELQVNRLKEPSFWEEAWSLDRENSLFRRGKKTLQEKVNHWNKRADNFRKHVMGKKGNRRVSRVLDWLERQGVELAGKEILDIGAGPGAFALAMARRCRTVIALEPAEGMAELLKAEVAAGGFHNVQVLQSTWEEIDPEKEGFLGRFDLVFASMSPGINNLDTIQKALDCSQEYFYCSSFAGLRESDIFRKLWQLLYGDTFPAWPDQVLFVFNILYALGLQVNMEVWEERRREELTMAEAMVSITDQLRSYNKEPPESEEKLQEFVRANMKDGLLLQQNRSRLGQILARKV
jgi:SAM-dependent methyltransferase